MSNYPVVTINGEMYHHPLMVKYPEYLDPDVMRSIDSIEFYLNRRAEGMSHNFAAMLATQRSPGAKTEAIYFEGRHTLAEQFKGNEGQLEAVVAAARAKGYNPSPYDVYEPGLADDMGDPKAFIKPSGGTTQVRQVCESHGKSCHGLVKVKGRRSNKAPEAAPLAKDIAERIVNRQITANPDIGRRHKRRDLVEEVRHQHGYSDAKRAGYFHGDKRTPEQITALSPPPGDSRSHYRERAEKARSKRKKK